jgi:hypothetical protein
VLALGTSFCKPLHSKTNTDSLANLVFETDQEGVSGPLDPRSRKEFVPGMVHQLCLGLQGSVCGLHSGPVLLHVQKCASQC